MTGVADLPNELLLMIFPHLPLQALIAARAVNHKWRHLAPLSEIHPTRRKLLQLYDQFVTSPAFHLTRPFIEPHLRSFDRQTYAAALPQSTPEDFNMWLLEWPARATIASLWPGLDAKFNMSEDVFVYRRDTRNLLVHKPQVHNHDLALFGGHAHVNALELFDEGNGWKHWVILEGFHNGQDLRGHVYSKVRGEDGADGYGEYLEADGWLKYLRNEMSQEQSRIEDAGLFCPCQGCQYRTDAA
ncbi:hypothetical protein BDW22DRAFT_1353749 [Trametopsis cervina]|nr:hypothetical protein BDW22DRAFT_1353749 [Trametopsis cervina]